MTEKQEAAGKAAIGAFCLLSYGYTMNFMALSAIFPVVVADKDISEKYAVIIVGLPIAISSLASPLLNWYIPKVGPESTIFQANIGEVLSFAALTGIMIIDQEKAFVSASFLAVLAASFFYIVIMVGESYMMLHYSKKEDREFNFGLIKRW
jgi:hypothetical protein